MFNELFEQQIKKLLGKGYPGIIGIKVDSFLHYINALRDELNEVGEIEENHIPFLIVIPACFVSIPTQWSLVKIDNKAGCTHINPGSFRNTDGIETPSVPYLVFDIECIPASAEKPFCSDERIKEFGLDGRRGLTVEEGIALITQHPEMLMLKDYNTELPGSRCGIGHVPGFSLTHNGPELVKVRSDVPSRFWGSASCRAL